jgi:hypothetical protein
VSSALMRPMTERFAADIRHYIDVRGLDLVRFAKGQSKARSPGGTWPGTMAGSRSCSPGWPRRRPGYGGPGSARTR